MLNKISRIGVGCEEIGLGSQIGTGIRLELSWGWDWEGMRLGKNGIWVGLLWNGAGIEIGIVMIVDVGIGLGLGLA